MTTAGHTAQLGFESLLADAEGANSARRFRKATAHLPGTMDEAVPYLRLLIRQHHAAMFDADVKQTMTLREDARALALKLNHGETGILAHDDAPGCMLARLSAAPAGTVPLWGQAGEFTLVTSGIAVRIVITGFFDIGSSVFFWPSFAAHVVDPLRPFLSETGYRSFFGCGADPVPGLMPGEFAAKVIDAYITHDRNGRLVGVEPQYRKGAGP